MTTTVQELTAAEERLNKAAGALHAYTGRPQELQTDIALHRRLAEELRQAATEYARLVFNLEPRSATAARA